MCFQDDSALLSLFQQVAPAELFCLLQRRLGLRVRLGIFTARLVIWMMIIQRLQRGTLASGVAQLAEGQFDPLLSQCKRVREKRIGLATGGYCQARQRLPKQLFEDSMKEINQRLQHRLLARGSEIPMRMFVLDGSTVQLEPKAELEKLYPPASNQHAKSHWPVLRIVVVHDLETGLAERPYWGPMYGRKAVGEQFLADLAIQHLPAGSAVIGDRNFGIFSTAYSAQQAGLGVILRLTAERAKSLLGRPISQTGDYAVCWRPSRWDGKKTAPKQERPWPADACIQGRMIAARVGRGKHKLWIYLFTTATLSTEEIIQLYGRRWQIETDLRSLKQTLGLCRVSAHSADMMEKELIIAVMVYNLVRAVMFAAAQRAKIDPRQLSFTYAANLVMAGYSQLLAATGTQQEEKLDHIIDLAARCRLPNRKKRRSYPREVWGRGYRYPVRRRQKN